MILSVPGAPFQRIKAIGDITIDGLNADILALKTGNSDILPKYNEFTLNDTHVLPTTGTYSLTNGFDPDTGLRNIQRNWIAVYDSSSSKIDFFLSTYRPEKLQFTVDSSGKLIQLVLNTRNGVIYHGQLIYSDLTRDSDSDLIPDVLDVDAPGSLPNFIKTHISIDRKNLNGGYAMSTPVYGVDGGSATSVTARITIDGGV
ncbi:MAG: hypothetical protein ABFD07_16530 [Methanobacterium sp.]